MSNGVSPKNTPTQKQILFVTSNVYFAEHEVSGLGPWNNFSRTKNKGGIHPYI